MNRRWIFFIIGLASLPWPASAGTLYDLDQRYGRIGFSVGLLGFLDMAGRFARFTGKLNLDPEHPESTQIDVDIDTDSVDIAWPGSEKLLRSPDFFDTKLHREAHFHSLSITPGGANHFYVGGEFQLRGVTLPMVLEATVKRHGDGAQMAYSLQINGAINRSDYGMVSDRPLVGDEVKLNIHLRLAVNKPGE